MSKGEQTRQRIIELAAPLFNQRGFAGCSMQDILEATGLKKGGIYRHFSSKEELAAEALRYALSQSVKIQTPPAKPEQSAVERLRCVVRQFVESPSPIRGGCPVLNSAVDCDDGNAVLRKLTWECVRNWRTRISEIVREGIRRKEIRRDVKPQAVANTMIATLEGATMISRLEGAKSAIEDAREALNAMIDGIALK